MSEIDEQVAVPRWLYDRLLADAAAWREFGQQLHGEVPVLALLTESPHVRELIRDWFEWFRRRQAAAASHAISAAGGWTGVAGAPTYAELRRRRAQPGDVADDARRRRGEYRGGPVDWGTGLPIDSGCGS
ncbi:hypothetical protein [Saccharopolyspora hattusasensis]|uniref:hypothetical protein n=1 Tax=Saccharopolyspora hattusasensis TaxID=1128679 RepID=UPI003D9934F9